MSYTVSQLQAIAAQDAAADGIPVQAFLDRITAESGWNPSAVNSTTGATGLGQVLASTAADPGYGVAPLVDRTDPVQNLQFDADLLAAYHTATGSWSGALAKYTGQPQSNFTQYDVATGDTSTSGNLTPAQIQQALKTQGAASTVAAGLGVTGAVSSMTSWTGWLGDYFGRGVIVVVGMIILAAGLFMLRDNSGTISGQISKLPKLPIPE